MNDEMKVDRLSHGELIKLAKKIDRKIRRAEDAELLAMMRMLAEMVRLSRGKYANPENQADVWNGSGRRPKWFNDYVASGGDSDDLLV